MDDDRVLREMSGQEGNGGGESGHHEEWPFRDEGKMFFLWDGNVSNSRKEVILKASDPEAETITGPA